MRGWAAGTALCLWNLLPPSGGIRGGACGKILFSRILSNKTRPLLSMNTLLQIAAAGNKEPIIRCPHCATTLICRYGTYKRAHPEEPNPTKIQRFLCKSKRCPRRTFSVLKHPFLPIVRHFLSTVLNCHRLCNLGKAKQAEGARRMNLSRGIIKRLSAFAQKFFPWFEREQKISDWGPDLDVKPPPFWPDFIRDFSQSFYPKRWQKLHQQN